VFGAFNYGSEIYPPVFDVSTGKGSGIPEHSPGVAAGLRAG